MTGRLFDFGVLVDLLDEDSPSAIAARVGVDRRTIHRRRHGSRRWIDEWEADRAATAAGYHPSHVWPDWFDLDDERVAS